MNKRKSSRFWTFIIVGLFVYFAYTMFEQEKVFYNKNREMNDIETKLNEEEKLENDLKSEMEILNSDEYNENVAREELGMVKRGEKIFIDINR